MFRIWKHFRFSASHILEGMPEGHQCGRLHGHNYTIEVELSAASLNEQGFVRDFGELRSVKDWVDATWDHRHLNDCVPFNRIGLNPTAENMARWLFDFWHEAYPEMSAVRVQETETSWAEYRP